MAAAGEGGRDGLRAFGVPLSNGWEPADARAGAPQLPRLPRELVELIVQRTEALAAERMPVMPRAPGERLEQVVYKHMLLLHARLEQGWSLLSVRAAARRVIAQLRRDLVEEDGASRGLSVEGREWCVVQVMEAFFPHLCPRESYGEVFPLY